MLCQPCQIPRLTADLQPCLISAQLPLVAPNYSLSNSRPLWLGVEGPACWSPRHLSGASSSASLHRAHIRGSWATRLACFPLWCFTPWYRVRALTPGCLPDTVSGARLSWKGLLSSECSLSCQPPWSLPLSPSLAFICISYKMARPYRSWQGRELPEGRICFQVISGSWMTPHPPYMNE